MKIGILLRFLLGSPAVYTAALYAVLGIGFAGSNLLLARSLSTLDYSLVVLVISLMNLSIPLAPVGLDGVVNRQSIDPGPWLLCCALYTSTLVGLVTIVAGRFIYGLNAILLIGLLAGTVAGGATFVAAAQYRSVQRFTLSVLLSQSLNFSLAIASITAVTLGVPQAWLPLTIIVMGYILTAAWGWFKLFKERPFQTNAAQTFCWREALYYAGVNAASLLLLQLERLLIPKLLTIEDLALFGVLAAIAIAPFRSLQLGVGYTLLPRLRAATTVATRRRLLAQEGMIVTFAILLGSIAIWYLTPFIVDWLLSEKYTISPALVLAALTTSAIKVVSTLMRVAVTALCNTQELAYLNILMWISVAVAIAGAILGARWGLIGVLWGVGLGWVSRGLVSTYLAFPYFRELHLPVVPAKGSSVE